MKPEVQQSSLLLLLLLLRSRFALYISCMGHEQDGALEVFTLEESPHSARLPLSGKTKAILQDVLCGLPVLHICRWQ